MNEMTPLDSDFVLGPFDVVCGRGKIPFNHSGNRNYRNLIDLNLPNYIEATLKMEKSIIVSSIVASIQEKSPQGGFVKKVGGRWFKVSESTAREKVGQSLRTLLQSKPSSATEKQTHQCIKTPNEVYDTTFEQSKTMQGSGKLSPIDCSRLFQQPKNLDDLSHIKARKDEMFPFLADAKMQQKPLDTTSSDVKELYNEWKTNSDVSDIAKRPIAGGATFSGELEKQPSYCFNHSSRDHEATSHTSESFLVQKEDSSITTTSLNEDLIANLKTPTLEYTSSHIEENQGNLSQPINKRDFETDEEKTAKNPKRESR